MSQALDRFKRWIAWVGLPSQADVAARLGCTQSMLSRLLSQEHRISLDLAAAIQRETADWPEGQILATEWAGAVVLPSRRYQAIHARKPGVRRKVGARS